ncbi:MAG: hypothetical protein KKF85_09390 [Gammaproteobacteria bacterium]|nr:hypothetical protein [Rhodocyclaceae bacterium]MBU3908118.1 hypothetical protein [Gammaproteobacteria bacterium]MBU3989001.1 hypothetical protein [Gammaproteobacteria bacterium]MBU4005759.1 hypothetical protein [Gammaproteobacteria bacterium]MBU4021493.1 hypothetical protein [Gammaproteobacteria bacterium]
MPKLFIDEFVGITNRLEVLPLAFALRKAYGHEIILDWHELDSLSIDDTRQGKVRLLARLGALRVRNCDRALFDALGGKKIILRSLDGPAEILDPIYLESARKVHLAPSLAASIRQSFAPYASRPVVGVHIRHGDYQMAREDRYEIAGVEWPAVPVWWYEKTMARIAARQPDVCFLLSSTGDPDSYPTLRRNFDVFTLDAVSPYTYKGADHISRVNPVADLFALACTPVMLATPVSGYSHWAANVLGSPTTCIVPIPGATPDDPLYGKVELYGRRLPVWREAGREGTDMTVLSPSLEELVLNRLANTDWL